MLRALLLPLLLLPLSSAPAQAEEPAPLPPAEGSGQQLSGQTLVDWDYGYTLHLPSTDWHLLPEERARSLYPDALGGAIAKNGHMGVAIFEDASGDLASMHGLLMTGLAASLTEVVSVEELSWRDRPAIRSVVDVTSNGMQVRQLRVVFLWEDSFVQLLCNGPLDPAENRCEELISGFTLNGTALRRRVKPATPDVATRGWRVEDGVFESAVNGFALRPPSGWRLMVGNELAQIHADAEVGLMRERPEAYAYLLPERAGESSLERLSEQYRRGFLENLAGATPQGELSVEVAGRPFMLLRVERPDAVPFTWWHGSWSEDTRYWQVVAWTTTPNADALTPEIATLLSGFSLLDEPRRAALEQTLSTVPVPVEIGPGWSLRDQVWTHYDLGLSWAAPPGLWQTSAGDAAEAIWTGAPVALEHLVNGAFAVLLPIDDLGSLASSHAALVESIGPLTEAPERARIAGQKARSSWIQTTNPLPMVWRISTFRAPNGQLLALVTYALASSLERARPDMLAVAETLSDTHTLQARVAERDVFESHRLGVRLALDGELPCQDPIPENAASQADGIFCGEGDRGVLLMAVRESSQGLGGEEVMLQLVRSMLGEEMGRLSGKELITSKGALGGQQTTRMSFGPQGERLEVELLSKDRVMVVFMAMGMSEAERERWRAGFSFIE